MKLSKKLIDEINSQLNFEQESAYIYLSMAYELESRGLSGLAQWMLAQHKEELGHSEAMAKYLLRRGARPIQSAIAEVPNKWGTVLEIFEAAYAHEQEVTRRIEALTALAIKEKDYNAEDFFRHFVDEQVEEEETFSGVIEQVKMAGSHGILMVDHHLGKRQ